MTMMFFDRPSCAILFQSALWGNLDEHRLHHQPQLTPRGVSIAPPPNGISISSRMGLSGIPQKFGTKAFPQDGPVYELRVVINGVVRVPIGPGLK